MKNWPRVLQEIKNSVSPQAYETWFAGIEGVEIDDGVAYIIVPDGFFAEWLSVRHGDTLRRALEKELGPGLRIEFKVKEPPRLPGKAPFGPTGLVPRFTLSNIRTLFYNRFAVAAVGAFVAGKRGNLLVMVGPPGVGKTHLASAGGIEFLRARPGASVRYVRLEAFFNSLLASLRDKKSAGFKKAFRNLDLLIIDDFQFAESKPFLQEELVHTMDSLNLKDRKVMVISSVHPKDMKLQGPLLSRLMGGLLVELPLPSARDRREFLAQALDDKGVAVGEGVIDFVAEACPGAVREMEGVVHRLSAYSSLVGGPVALDAARAILADLVVVKTPAQRVLESITDFMGVARSELLSGSRKRRVSMARHLISYILREKLGLSLQEAAEALGGVHHTAVLYGAERVRKDKKLLDLAERLWGQIGG